MRIALDAMGGDDAPGPIVEGAVEAVHADSAMTVVLVGDQSQIENELARFPDAPRDRLPILHASESIGMDEKPVEALRKKRDNSISRSWMLLAKGEVAAVVSAGNTGAMVASGLFNAKMFCRACDVRPSPRSGPRRRGLWRSSTLGPTWRPSPKICTSTA